MNDNISPQEQAEAQNPNIGDGSAANAPLVAPSSAGAVALNPLRFLLSPIVLLAFAAAAQGFIAGADVRGIITGVLGVLILAAQELARSKVTPVARPMLDAEIPLVPA